MINEPETVSTDSTTAKNNFNNRFTFPSETLRDGAHGRNKRVLQSVFHLLGSDLLVNHLNK
jgi:hypothetical protein